MNVYNAVASLMRTYWNETNPPLSNITITEKRLGIMWATLITQILIDEVPNLKIQQTEIGHTGGTFRVRHPVRITVWHKPVHYKAEDLPNTEVTFRHILTQISDILSVYRFVAKDSDNNIINRLDPSQWIEEIDRDVEPIIYKASMVVYANYYYPNDAVVFPPIPSSDEYDYIHEDFAYLIINNSGVYSAINGNTRLIEFGGSNDAGGIDGTDASAVFQAVFNVSTPKRVYVKTGTYPNLNVKLTSNLELCGEGIDATILKGLSNESLFYNTDGNAPVSNIYIHDLTLDGNLGSVYKLINTKEDPEGIDTTIYNLTVERVKFICGTTHISVHIANALGITVRDCKLSNPYNVSDLLAFDGTDILIENNTFDRDIPDGGSLLTSGGGKRIKIIGNSFTCVEATPPKWSAAISMEDYLPYEDLLIEGNSTVNCSINVGGVMLLGNDYNDVRVLNNRLDGGEIGLVFSSGGTLANVKVKNNTISKVALSTSFFMSGSIHGGVVADNDFIDKEYVVFSADDFIDIKFRGNTGFITEAYGFAQITDSTEVTIANPVAWYPTSIQVTCWEYDTIMGMVSVAIVNESTFKIITENSGTYLFSVLVIYDPFPLVSPNW